MKIHNGERLCPTNQSPFLPLLCQFQVHSWLITKVSQKKGKMAKIDAKGKINICSWMALGLISKFSPPISESNNYGNMIPRFPRSYIDTLFTYMVRIRQYRYIYFLATIFSSLNQLLYREDKGKLIYQTRSPLFCCGSPLK